MPKTNTCNPEVQEYFCEVGRYWVREFDIDGWRLDVASEINDGFWRAFRQAVKEEKPECVLIGEVWETAQHWLNGDIFDSTMNYDFRKHCRRFFAEQSIDAAEFDARVTNMRMRYKLPVLYAQLNLLDSHDVSRFYSLCEKDPARMQLAVLFQMTFTGIPSVFYGDERGIYGLKEAEYRHEMTWSQEPPALAEFYKKAMHLRTEHPALCRGSYHTIKAEKKNELYGYERIDGKEKITVFLNNQSAAAEIPPMNGKMLWQQGYEVVEGVKRTRGKENVFHKLSAGLFYKLISKAVKIDMSRASDFKLMDRRAVEALLAMPERNAFFRALSSWIGFRTTSVEFDVQEREIGESKWSTKSLIRYAISNIVSFSSAPMTLVTITGILGFLFAVILGIQTLVNYFSGHAVEGFTTVILIILIMGSLILMGLGVIGYYIAKIYEEVKCRPRYIVSRKVGAGMTWEKRR